MSSCAPCLLRCAAEVERTGNEIRSEGNRISAALPVGAEVSGRGHRAELGALSKSIRYCRASTRVAINVLSPGGMVCLRRFHRTRALPNARDDLAPICVAE